MKTSILLRTFAIVTAATMLFFGVLFAALYQSSVRVLKEEAISSATVNMDMIRFYLGSRMDLLNEYIYQFMSSPELSSESPDQIKAFFERTTPLESSIGTRLLLIDGELQAIDAPYILSSMKINTEFYRLLSQRDRLVITEPYYSHLVASRTVAAVRSRIEPATGREIVLIFEIRLDRLFDELNQKLASGKTLVVLSTKGKTVYLPTYTSLLSGLVAREGMIDLPEEIQSQLMSLKIGVNSTALGGRKVMIEKLRYDELWNLYIIVDSNQFYAAANQLIRSFVQYGVPAALLLIAVCMIVSASVTRPIKRLVRQVDQLHPQDGQLRLQSPSQDEVGTLAASFNSLLNRLQQANEDRERMEHSHFQMEYKVLQSQIQPHFLFNVHMCIDGLLERGETKKARDMLSSLDALLRNSTDKAQSIVSLSDEMHMLEQYLSLQLIRSGHSFDYAIGDWSHWSEVRVPKLLLQPIVENALYHGLSAITWRGRVTVDFEEIDQQLHIFIRDNGAGMPTEELRRIEANLSGRPSQRGMVSIGLTNVRSRIKRLYGSTCDLYVFSRENLGTTVELVINIHLAEDHFEPN